MVALPWPRRDGNKAIAAGDRAEISGRFMSQLASIQRRTDGGSMAGSGGAPPRPGRDPEPQDAAPALAGAVRPGFVAEAPALALLERPGQPLARRGRRSRDRLRGLLAGSGFVHLAALLLLALSFEHLPGGKPQEAQPVEMMYEHPGRSGMSGQPHSTPSPPPPAQEQQPVPELQPPAAAPPVPVPPLPPLPELPSPEALPQKLTSAKPQHQPTAHDTSPLSHPMDLSFSRAPTHHRAGRPPGAGGAIDLSLGPMVQNGQLLTPYASATSIRGVSSDYEAELSAWIRRHMYYPEEAARHGEDGPSHVHVVLDRQGQVKSIRLVSSSGSYTLDDATQGMFRGATLPPVPPDMSGKAFDVDLTIDYILIRR